MKYINDKIPVQVKVYDKHNPKRYQIGTVVGTQSDRGIVSVELDSGIDVDVPGEYVVVVRGRRGMRWR